MKTKNYSKPNQSNFRRNRLFYLWGVILAFAVSAPMYATGVDSGTNITCKATITYDVNSITQDVVESSPTGNTTQGAGNGTDTAFVVDNNVDLTVSTTDVAAVSTTPGAVQADGVNVLEFSVQNTGNTVQDYALSATVVATSGATKFDTEDDDFDMTSVSVFVESGATAGYQVAEDTGTYVDELAKDTSETVYIVADTPLAALDGQYASYHLLVTTHDGGGAASLGGATTETGAPDTPGSVDIAFADGQGSDTGNDAVEDGKHSSQDDYKVGAAIITVTKTSAIVSDPVHGTGANRLALPGAVMRYTIVVTNTGTSNATSVTIVDTVTPGNTVYDTETITLDATGKTDADDADEADFDVTNSDAVTVVIPTLVATTGTATITFDVIIQ